MSPESRAANATWRNHQIHLSEGDVGSVNKIHLVVEVWMFPNELGWIKLKQDFKDLVRLFEAKGYKALGEPETMQPTKVLNGDEVLVTTIYRDDEQATIEEVLQALSVDSS